MGCGGIGFVRAFVGFLINSDAVINFNGDSERCVRDHIISSLQSQLKSSFEEFLTRKFGDSVPQGFISMNFYLFYMELSSDYDSNPYGFPYLLIGFCLDDYISNSINSNGISEINLNLPFPPNSKDLIAEFLAEYKLKGDQLPRVMLDEHDYYSSEEEDYEENLKNYDKTSDESKLGQLKAKFLKQLKFNTYGEVMSS